MKQCRLPIALLTLLGILVLPSRAAGQQRPLITEDPEPIGAGRVLLEGGVDAAHGVEYPASGLKGNLWRIPSIGISVGISSIAELQIDGGLYDKLYITERRVAPLSNLLTIGTDTTTHDVEDIVVATKIRLASETEGRPAIGVRFATKLPNASNESGLGLDTTDFYMTLLGAKTVESIRVVGNFGFGILADPVIGNRQNDVLTYGLSFARAVTQQAEIVGEVVGRISTRSGDPFPGTESRGLVKIGGRYTISSVRFDAAGYAGLTSIDPTFGFTVGVTYVFSAFRIP